MHSGRLMAAVVRLFSQTHPILEGLQEAGVETAVGTNPRPGAVLVAQCPLDPTAQPLDQVALGMTQWMDWRGGEGDWWPAVTPLLCPRLSV